MEKENGNMVNTTTDGLKVMDSLKALFVGISYKDFGHLDLGKIPYKNSKYLQFLFSRIKFKDTECLILTDDINAVANCSLALASKKNTTAALKAMVAKAKVDGDSLLFYFCGHGAPADSDFKEVNGSYGKLNTLNDDCSGKDGFRDNELREILKSLPEKVNMTILIHSCFGGLMFVKPNQEPSDYSGNCIAISSVGPKSPAVLSDIEDLELKDRHDFSGFLCNRLFTCSQSSQDKLPTYNQLFEDLEKSNESWEELYKKKGFIEKDLERFKPKFYCQEKKKKLKFLENPVP